MTPNSGRAIELFTEATQLPIEERAAFLERACGGDEALRLKIEALLKSNDRAGDFLETPLTGSISEGRAKIVAGEKPGDRVDRYVLAQQIGEGGCGVVFVAEQQEPVLRRVALKVVKPGMDTKSVLARFEAERQALALMDHPNIAHVFDAGATASGRPYFVMELVEGVKITDYCDQRALPITARLELFAQVCEAIQHAHQKGIIHRDIKPSNILVTTAQGEKPTPKVIDFGIAKATTGQQLTDKTIFTALEMLIGTPAYMSPEQAALTTGDVDTRTDIYSLGVLLYELLTGTTPFDTRELLKAGLDEVRRVIRNEEPVRPSTRLSTMVAADLVNISKHHGAEAPKLIREVRGDLDWIVMKALEKESARRYATANGFAMDIKRYLENDTVLARPPSHLYQFQKLVTRHKLEFAALGIIVTALVVALAVSTWSLSKEKLARKEAETARHDADQQRKKAEARERRAFTEATKSQQVVKFLDQMLLGVNPKIANGRDTTMLREILDETAERIRLGRELTNEPAVQADLSYRVGRVYGFLGLWDKEEPLLSRALQYYRKFPEGIEQNLANTLAALSLMHSDQPDQKLLGEAEQEAREALSIFAKLRDDEDIDVVKLKTNLGWVVLKRGKTAEAGSIFREALATGRNLGKEQSDELLDTRNGLARVLLASRNPGEAENLYRESLSIAMANHGTNHLFTATCLWNLAQMSEGEGKLAQAEDLYQQVLVTYRKLLPKDHPYIEKSLSSLAFVLRNERKTAPAADAYRELLEFRQNRYGRQDGRVLATVSSLVEILLADDTIESQFGELAAKFPEAWVTRSELFAQHGLWSEAMAAASSFLEIQPDNHEGYHLAAPLLVKIGDFAAYERLCLKIATLFAGTSDPYTADRMAKDCLVLPRLGADLKVPAELAQTAVTVGEKDTRALPFFQCCKALAEYRQRHWEAATNWAVKAAKNPLPYSRAEAYAILAMAHFQLKQTEEARATLMKCAAVLQKLPKLTDGNLGQDWRDLILARTLQSEAKQLIEGESSLASPTGLPR